MFNRANERYGARFRAAKRRVAQRVKSPLECGEVQYEQVRLEFLNQGVCLGQAGGLRNHIQGRLGFKKLANSEADDRLSGGY